MSGSRDDPLFRATGYAYTHPPNDTWTCDYCGLEWHSAQRYANHVNQDHLRPQWGYPTGGFD